MLAMVPDGHGSVALEDVPEPPAPEGADVVVQVAAYSVNRGETFLLAEPRDGWRPGKDVAGTVVAAGPAAALRVGDRAVAHPEEAGWAERVTVPADRIAALPDGVPFGVAAALPLAGLTALRLVRAVGALPGRSILLTGASGGVGHYLVELVTALGAEVTAVVGAPERGRRLAELGARVVTSLDDADPAYDVVIESVGGDTFAAAWRRLAAHGLFVWMGQAGGRPAHLDFLDWTGGTNATLRKFVYWDSDVTDGEDLATLVRLVGGGHLHPEIGRVADWRKTAEVLTDLVERRVLGNAVLEVAA